MNNTEPNTGTPSAEDIPAWTAGTWNRRKIRGGTFLSNADIFELIKKAETLPRLELIHKPDFYAKVHDGQPEPEAMPADIPRAILKTPKARKTGKAPTSQIYLPIEYAGRDVLVIALTPEESYLIDRAEHRRRALEILKEYPEDENILCESVINDHMEKASPDYIGQYAEALPDELKRRTAAEIIALKGVELPDGSTAHAPPSILEKIKQDPEKYLKERNRKVRK